jgi:hypothetical protein
MRRSKVAESGSPMLLDGWRPGTSLLAHFSAPSKPDGKLPCDS